MRIGYPFIHGSWHRKRLNLAVASQDQDEPKPRYMDRDSRDDPLGLSQGPLLQEPDRILPVNRDPQRFLDFRQPPGVLVDNQKVGFGVTFTKPFRTKH